MNYELLLKKPRGIEPWAKSSACLLKYDETLHFWTNFKFCTCIFKEVCYFVHPNDSPTRQFAD